jgi:hypothetical protein
LQVLYSVLARALDPAFEVPKAQVPERHFKQLGFISRKFTRHDYSIGHFRKFPPLVL